MSYSKAKQQQQFREGKDYERLFCKVTGATMGTPEEDRRHIDCHWKGFTVDVKGNKRSHAANHALVEFSNVAGKDGWAKVGADLIAFMFDDGFLVVRRKDVMSMAQKKVAENVYRHGTSVMRQNRTSAEQGLYRLCGRSGRKDVFTYITKDDLLGLTHVIVKI